MKQITQNYKTGELKLDYLRILQLHEMRKYSNWYINGESVPFERSREFYNSMKYETFSYGYPSKTL